MARTVQQRTPAFAWIGIVGGFVLVVVGIAAPRLGRDCECRLTAEQQYRLLALLWSFEVGALALCVGGGLILIARA